MTDHRRIWGQRIRTHRERLGQSQRSIAVALGVDQAVVSRWERGITSPRDDRRLELAALLGVSPDLLFSYEPDPANGDDKAA
jgi:transcriptional regulator with XRE-family HTH domain